MNQTKVYQFDFNGIPIASYNSIKEASEATNALYTSITNSAQGRTITAGGFIWEYTPTTSRTKEIRIRKVKVQRLRTEKKKRYWDVEQDDLFNQYLSSTDHWQKSKIYSELRPAILTMIESVMRRYFKSYLANKDQKELINDCEISLIIKTFPHFDSNRGKAYSFIGNSTKNYFYQHFLVEKRLNTINGEIESEDDSFNQLEHDQTYSDLKQLANNHLNLLIKSRSRTEVIVLKAIKELILETDFGKFYSSYFLLTKTRMEIANLKSVLYRLDMLGLIYPHKPLSFYERRIKEKSKNTSIKDFLNTLEHEIKNKRQYPITQKQAYKREIAKKKNTEITLPVYENLG